MRKNSSPSLKLWFLLALVVLLPTGCGRDHVVPTTQFVEVGGGDATGIEGTLPKASCFIPKGIGVQISNRNAFYSGNLSDGRTSRAMTVTLTTSATQSQYSGDQFVLTISKTKDPAGSGKYNSHVTAVLSGTSIDTDILCAHN